MNTARVKMRRGVRSATRVPCSACAEEARMLRPHTFGTHCTTCRRDKIGRDGWNVGLHGVYQVAVIQRFC